jgi:hypothetical protein
VYKPVQAGPLTGAAVQRKAVAWTLTTSTYFMRRKKEAESRDFGDMENIFRQQFDVDWSRVACKERFVAMIGRSDKALLATDREALQAGVLHQNCPWPFLLLDTLAPLNIHALDPICSVCECMVDGSIHPKPL